MGATIGRRGSRRFVIHAALWLSRRTSHLALTDTHNGLRVLSRHALTRIRLHHAGMAHASELEGQISRHRLRWTEYPVTVLYTAHSRGKGQSNLNAVNIVYDLAVAKVRAAS